MKIISLAREPVFHFLAIGAAIFSLHTLTATPDISASDYRIVINGGEVARLTNMWEKRWGHPPTAEEFERLIAEQIREEVLYRQALALGLDRDDMVIRRHLRQKFEFLTQDLAVVQEPEAAELTAWFEANRERYRTGTILSFTQIYFNADRRGAAAEEDARLTLASLRGGNELSDAVRSGDAQMLDHQYRNRTASEIEALFGGRFVDTLLLLEPGVWVGPVASGYGVHLVRLEALTPGIIPPFEAVAERVRNDWAYEQRQQANEAIFQRLLARYNVVVERPVADGASVDGGAPR